MTPAHGPLLIVGSSGRAAAASALRAGYEPFVIDLFADADTRRLCPTLRCPPDEYPAGLVRLARQAPPGPWMYTGGLENHPAIVAAISANRPLIGNGPQVLAKVRDPFHLREFLSGVGLAPPRLYRPDLRLPEAIRWLRKPLAGAGGFGIRFATDDDVRRAADPGVGYYLQEFVPGPSFSLLAATTGPGVSVLGVTRQLVGEPWLHAKPFQYAGNIAGIDAAAELAGAAARLAAAAGLVGPWGFDFVRHGGPPFVIEINPRYTASAEVLEYATGAVVLGAARGACPTRVVGKAIYYAAARLTFPASGPWDESLARCTGVWRRPDFADIPDPGTVVEPGHPVLTILTDARSDAECEAKLKQWAASLDRLFGFRTPAEDEP